MNRTKSILAAGTLTGLVLITLLGLGLGNLGALSNGSSATAVPQEPLQQPPITATDPAAAEAIQAWQAYGAELEETVRVMQERETAYQTQLESANQTIVNLEGQINSTNSSSGFYEDDDDDDDDDDYEDDEHEEHEEHDDDEDEDDDD